MNEVTKLIDIEKLIRESKSKFVNSLPKFVIRHIIKSVHQEEMNETIHKYRNLSGVSFINALLNEWNIKVVIKGGERIPASGRFVFVANHPVGGIDALSVLSMINSFYPDIVSPSNELFNYIPQLRPVVLGINVFGKNTKETAEKLNKLYESDTQIMMFPAGEVSRRKNGIISDIAWQKSFITKSIQYKRDIIPVHISGRNSMLFYFIANLRKLLGIKLYIETALLPHEMMKQKNSTIIITVGQLLPWQTFTSEKSHNAWAQYVKEIVAGIPADKHNSLYN